MILYFMITFAFQIGKGFAIMVALFSFRVGNFRFDLENNSSSNVQYVQNVQKSDNIHYVKRNS